MHYRFLPAADISLPRTLPRKGISAFYLGISAANCSAICVIRVTGADSTGRDQIVDEIVQQSMGCSNPTYRSLQGLSRIMRMAGVAEKGISIRNRKFSQRLLNWNWERVS